MKKLDQFRALAESAITTTPAGPERPREQDETLRLAHELKVHEYELLAQQQELRDAYWDLEEARDRYRALFELAPVGYLCIERDRCVVRQANAAAGSLLGLDLEELEGHPLAARLDQANADALHLHLQEVFSSDGRCSVKLAAQRPDGAHVSIRMDSVAVADYGGRGRHSLSALIELSQP